MFGALVISISALSKGLSGTNFCVFVQKSIIHYRLSLHKPTPWSELIILFQEFQCNGQGLGEMVLFV